jgi:hypothetical protein
MKMKRILALIAILLPLAACHKETPAPKEKDVVFVSIKAFETKARIGTNSLPSWSEGDTIGILADGTDSPAEFTLRSGAGYSSASFEGVIPGDGPYVVYSPASADCDGTTFQGILEMNISCKQPSQALGALPLWGRARDLTDVHLESPCGMLRLNLKGSTTLKSITLDAGKPVSGAFLCNLTDGMFAMVGGANIIMLDAAGAEIFTSEYTPFWFVLPPGEYDQLEFTITATDGDITYFSVDDTVTIEAGVFSSLSLTIE